MKRKAIPLLLLLCLLSGCQPEAEAVSTSGGYVAACGGSYYFANAEDGNRLYRMDSNCQNPEKLSQLENASRAIELRQAENRLYYLHVQEADTTWPQRIQTLYCYDPALGTETKLAEENILSYTIASGWIYYSALDPDKLGKMRLDGTDHIALTDSSPSDFMFTRHAVQVRGNKLLYACDEAITELDMTDGTKRSFPGYASTMLAYRSQLYIINAIHNRRLEKISVKTLNNAHARTLVEKDVRDISMCGGRLYFSDSEGGIYRTGLNGGGKRFVANGSCPIALSRRLFFLNEEGVMTWRPI